MLHVISLVDRPKQVKFLLFFMMMCAWKQKLQCVALRTERDGHKDAAEGLNCVCFQLSLLCKYS